MQCSNRFLKYLLALLLAMVLCAGLLLPGSTVLPPEPQSPTAHFSLSQADRETEIPASAEYITLENSPEGLTLTGGSYVLRGTMEGQLLLDAQDQVVHLFLDGVSIRSGYGSALKAVSGSKVIITCLPGTENTLRDTGSYPEGQEENACLYTACDLTLNGSGSLNVFGYHKDAIHCKDQLRILDGNLHLLAKRDGARANDGILITGGTLLLEAEKASLHTTKSGKEGKGSVELLGGDLSLIAGTYAIHAASDVTIRDCTVYEKAVLGAVSCEGSASLQEGCVEHG